MFKLGLEKAEEPEIKLPASTGSSEKQESSRKISTFCFIDSYKSFDSEDHNKLWKILQEIGVPDYLTCLLRNLYAGQEATKQTWNNRLVPNWERNTSRLYTVTLLFYLFAYLTYMPSTSCEMLGWMKLKLESRLQGEISTTSDMQMTPPYGRKGRGTKECLDESEKAGLKLNIQKAKIKASSPITSWQIDGETIETVIDYFLRLQNHCSKLQP